MGLNISDLSPEIAAKLGILPPQPRRQSSFTKEAVRQNAIRVMAVMDKLTQSERKRVLQQALKLNEV